MNISVAGVAERDGRVLIALRNPGTSIGEKWEFPGGKLEAGESPEQALKREYLEELGVSIDVEGPLCEGRFNNGPKNYRLLAFKIKLENDNFNAPEHQRIEWADISKLGDYEFPYSDKIIVDYLLSR